MGDSHGLIPLSDSAKHKGDVVAIGTAVLSFFKTIPWPELAAFLACIYTVLRILELVLAWVDKKRK